MEDRIIELETLVAFQEKTINQLSDVVHKQAVQLEDLERRMRLIEEQMRDVIAPGQVTISADEEGPPPHY